ncbi:MAG: GNAT family N-acetyltransferase, partial [Pseudomonadota bacterium]
MLQTRWSREDDVPRLAEIRRMAWTHAYTGLIPAAALARLASEHGMGWWLERVEEGQSALVIELADTVQGYAWIGKQRGLKVNGDARGEIYELYLDPAAQGTGLGRKLFASARARLAEAGFTGVVVRSLAENESGCRFYRALGGQEVGCGMTRVDGQWLPEITFSWR